MSTPETRPSTPDTQAQQLSEQVVAARQEAQKLRALAGVNPPVLPQSPRPTTVTADLKQDHGLTYLVKRLYIQQGYSNPDALRASLAISADLIDRLQQVPVLSSQDQIGLTVDQDGGVSLFVSIQKPYPSFVNLILKPSDSPRTTAPQEVKAPVVQVARQAQDSLR